MALYQCLNCNTEYSFDEPRPVTCQKCDSKYVKWVDYEESPLELVHYPNPVLKTKCREVEESEFGSSLVSFSLQMINVMKASRGVGLAANQVGDTRRIVVMKSGSEYITLVNPVITEKSKEIVKEQEGCLSFPGILEVIDRHKTVTVEYSDAFGLKKTKEFTNIDSICIQHEIDHLNGLTFIDRMSRLKKQIAFKKMSKLGDMSNVRSSS